MKAHLKEQLPAAALALIPEGTRGTISNALRVAAAKFTANAEEFRNLPGGYAQLAQQFDKQAEEASDLAERFADF